MESDFIQEKDERRVSYGVFYLQRSVYPFNDPLNTQRYITRLNTLSKEWHSAQRTGCFERVYLPPITTNTRGQMVRLKSNLSEIKPLGKFYPDLLRYKSFHGTDIFVLRDDAFMISRRHPPVIPEIPDLHSIPFKPQDRSLLLLISGDATQGHLDTERQPQWLKVYYYKKRYKIWINLDGGSWVKRIFDDPSYVVAPTCCCSDDQYHDMEGDLEAIKGYLDIDDDFYLPFKRHEPPRNYGPLRVRGPTIWGYPCMCCEEEG